MAWDFRGQPALNDPVEVVEHDPRWAAMFQRERERLSTALGALAVAIEHVGSTAVPGLAAKPVLDIMVGVEHTPLPEDALRALGTLGYQYRGDGGIPDKQYFRTSPRTRHLHVVPFGGEDWVRTLAFRDYLRAHPAAVREYEQLKRELARLHRTNRGAYVDGKAPFIRELLRRATMAHPGVRGSAAATGTVRSERTGDQ